MNERQNPLTLMIPTKNRSDLLIRALHYYARVECPFVIAIGDSSSVEQVEATRRVIRSLEGRLTIVHREYPQLNDSACIKALIEDVQTPYAVFVADDDFLVPKSLSRCMEFLKEHPDYSAAHGDAIQMVVKESLEGHFLQMRTGFSPQPVIAESSARRRVGELLNRYRVTLFSVHRTEIWEKMYRRIAELSDKSFTEILPCCLSAVYGKIKALDGLSLVRLEHERRYRLPDYFDWLKKSEWARSYAVFSDCLAAAISQTDGINRQDADLFVKKAFWLHLSQELSHELQRDHGLGAVKTKTRIQRQLNRFPRLAQTVLPLWRGLKPAGRYSLEVLLKDRSPYREDFRPIYETVRSP